ncbi:hypothetical protein ABT072_28670 [Streptomyces sp. NPDC002589]|uniref:hypothetical protein n=1 Tax=Streptomyces sp. NPDC002589 TaxID=3154420 RepID=UPI0033298FF2
MRVKLRPSVLYGTTENSVFVQSPRGAFTLKLPAALVDPVRTWLSVLERPTSTEELLATVGGSKGAPVLERVLRHLRDHGVLLDVPDDAVPDGVPAAAVAYAESHLTADPYPVLRRLAGTEVTVCGEPELVRAAAAALGDRGIAAQAIDGDGDGPGLRLRDASSGVTVSLRCAGERLWLTSSDLTGDPRAAAELERRLARPGQPRPAAARIGAALAADQVFRELLGLEEASSTVHVIDSAPLGWRTRRIERAAGPAPETADALDAELPAADDLLGLYRWDTPADWPQIPMSLARVVPGPDAAGRTAAAGWGFVRAEAKSRALAAFLRGTDPGRGAGVTLKAAVLDAALREAGHRLLDDPGTPWHDEPPVPAAARDIPGLTCRVHTSPAGAALACVHGEHGRAATWATDPEQALDHAAGTYLALQQGLAHTGVLLDTQITESLADTIEEAYSLARALLGAPVVFQPDADDVLLGHPPLVAGRLVIRTPEEA